MNNVFFNATKNEEYIYAHGTFKPKYGQVHTH